MNHLISDINDVLTTHGITDVIQLRDITITDKTVSDLVKQTPKLSNAITNHVWPSVPSAQVFHYTSREATESILATGIFRLTNIAKRLNDGEIITFCKTHKLSGYLENDANGIPRYRSLLMPQLFYASFTESKLLEEDEEYFWNNFAASDGVRLTFDIQATNPNFRRIVYEPKPDTPIPVLSKLIDTISVNHNRELVLQGISRLCAFYLNGTWSKEKEYRALFKSWPGIDPKPIGIGPTSYVEIPLEQAIAGYTFRITEVHSCTRPNMPSSYAYSQRKTYGGAVVAKGLRRCSDET